MRRLMWTTTAAVAFVVGDTWLQYLTGTDLFGHRPEPERLSGPFDGLRPGIFITKMMFPALLGAFVWRAWRRPWAKGVLLAFLLASVGAVFVSGERMALLLALGGLALAAVLQKGVLRKMLVASLVLTAVAIAALALVDPRMLGRHVDETVTTIEHFGSSPYGEIWRSALHLTAERPLQGVGMKNFRVACADPVLGLPAEVKVRCATHTHNTYLEFLTEAGVPGLMLFVALVVSWARRLWQAWRIEPHDPWLLGPLVAAAVLLWPLGPSASFFSNWFGTMVWLFVGWALAAARRRPAAVTPV
jgi:O-antigen ligase